ncbi:hypothetical protein GW17_00061503, partial [Ensete ventricosum]
MHQSCASGTTWRPRPVGGLLGLSAPCAAVPITITCCCTTSVDTRPPESVDASKSQMIPSSGYSLHIDIPVINGESFPFRRPTISRLNSALVWRITATILRGHLSPPSRTFSAPKISPTSSAVDDDFYTRSPASS